MSTTTEEHVAVHRYPYTIEEYITFILAGVAAGGAVLLLGWGVIIAVAAFVAGVVAPAALSRSRKDRSQVTATIKNGRLSVISAGSLGKSDIDLDQIESVSFREVNGNPCFVLRGGESNALLPERILTDSILYRLVEDSLAKFGTRSVREEFARVTKPA